ncbi:acetyl-CoA carboxylase biotin carboxyl carrier protein [Psychrobacter sp. PL15]|uniref:acetyl-CoA carboxylase biotin carboxyl carrier protein n=1 Tax=Psychrobacter sp. PL15 TaxID=3071719 RepID=UPI002DFA73F5|nr:acetyl-CoA carboxylase biotin carboxyl carrier protein [Psychrobacter sp. PL15]
MNINFTDLEKLIKLAERSDINSLEVTDGDARISIVCQPNGNENSTHNLSTSLADSASSSEQQTDISAAGNKENTNDINASSNGIDEKIATDDVKNQVLAPMISAPMLGTFYRRSEPTANAFVEVGEQVEEGQTLCIIEAMKMMHEVKAEAACTIKDALVDEGDVVEYGQSLFVIEPNS